MATDLAAPGRPTSAIWRCHRRPQARTRLARRSPLRVQAELLPAPQLVGRPAPTESQLRAARPVRSDKASAGMPHSVARGRRTRKAQARSAREEWFQPHFLRSLAHLLRSNIGQKRKRPPTEVGLTNSRRVFLLVERQARAIPMVFHRSPGQEMTGLRALRVAFVAVDVSAGSGIGKRGPAGRGASDPRAVAYPKTCLDTTSATARHPLQPAKPR